MWRSERWDSPWRFRNSGRGLAAIRLAGPAALALLMLGILVPGWSPTSAGDTECACESCHTDPHAGGWSGCVACHQSPPATGAHLVHFQPTDPPTDVAYGDTGVHSGVGAYKFGCGNCHPLDAARHRNGTVDVELANPAAPVGSIKAKNPAAASWSAATKTCTNVYCHSGKTVSSTPVGQPLTSPPDPVPPGSTTNYGYIMDATCSNLTYGPYNVTVGRAYATTPAWDAAPSFGACTECHQLPLTTSYPSVEAGVGDTHQWIDSWGYGNLHAYNMSFDPISCRTCHYLTVTQAGAASRDGMDVTTYAPVPIASHAVHVNGVADVAFDTVDPVVYQNSYSLAGATWDPATGTCTTVACHASPATGSAGARWQSSPVWGRPYRWDWGSAECDLCHRYGPLGETCQP